MDQIYKTDLNELFSYQRKGEKLEEKEKVIEIEIAVSKSVSNENKYVSNRFDMPEIQ